MAKKTPTRMEKGLTRNDLSKIWTSLGDARWLEILQKYKPRHGFTAMGGGTLKGLCLNPDHADTSPSFYLHTLDGHAHCFGCQYHATNPIELLELILEASTSDVFTFLQDTYEIRSLSKKAQAEFEKQRINLATKDAIFSATHAALCDAAAQPNNADYAFAQPAVKWLCVERAIPEDSLHCLPVGVMPPLTRLSEIITDQFSRRYAAWKANPTKNPEPQNYAEQATKYLHDWCQTPFFSGAVVWPLHVTPKEIGRLKLRAPHSNAKKDIIIPDDPFEDLLGIYGLGWEQYRSFTQDPLTRPDFAYITEGEMDVMSIMSRFVMSGDVKYPIFSAGGTGGTPHIEPILKMSGFKKAFFIGDSPHGKGNKVVSIWLDRMPEIEAKVFSGWDMLAPYKDLDEAVVKDSELLVTNAIQTKFTENFVSSWQWACDQATQEISTIPAHDLRNVVLAASKHGRYLRNRLDCDIYVQVISQKYDLNPDILKREIASREDSEDGFMLRLKDALSDLLYLVGTDTSAQGKTMVLFNKKNKSYHRFKLDNQQSIFQELAPVIGPPCDFVRDYVGYPGFLPDPAMNANSLGHLATDKAIRGYTNVAVMKWSKGAPNFSTANILNQGYHFTTDQDGNHHEYIVCGSDVFKLHRDVSGETKYQLLDGPSDGSLIFNATKQQQAPDSWYPGGLTIANLNSMKDVDIRAVFKDLTSFFDVGFRFKHQRVVPQLLATLAMLFPIMDAFERPPLLFVTGDTNSGKSTLLNVFGNVGVLNNTGLRLLFGSTKYDNYSSASAAYEATCSSLLRIYDEFEISHRNARHAEAVRAIYELYRTLVNGLSNRIRKNAEGGVDRIVLRHPIIFGAISGADVPQDINRLTVVEMRQVKGGFFPLQLLQDALGQEKINYLGRVTNLALFHHVPALRALYPEVVKEYQAFEASLPIPIDSRYVSAFFSTFTLMSYLGVDWKKFFYDWCVANEDTIVRSASIRESDSILREMMGTYVIKQSDRDNLMCVAQLLATPDTREDVNTAGVGMYYDRQNKLLLINITQAIPRLLSRQGQLTMTPTRLKDILDRHSAALTTKEVLQSGILDKIARYMGTDVGAQHVVVLHADQWLGSATVTPITADAQDQATKEATPDAPSANPSDYDFNAKD